jgi:selenophosphate synthetase-related protein
MLLECSQVGGVIALDAIPRAADVPLARWLTAFPSFGYLLSVRPDRTPTVLARFEKRGIAAATIGVLDASRIARVQDPSGATAEVWDFAASPLIGCGRSGTEPVR